MEHTLENLTQRCDALVLDYAAYCNQNFWADYIYNTVAIEGSPLSHEEVATLVAGGAPTEEHPLNWLLEVEGHLRLRDYLSLLREEHIHRNMEESLMLDFHSQILLDKKDDRGRFRQVPVFLTGVSKQLAEPWEISTKIRNLLDNDQERKKQMHPIERIARFHLEFESIHPFIDGNGRTGRMLMNFQLEEEGYPPIIIQNAHKDAYYHAFARYDGQWEADGMVALIHDYLWLALER